MTDRTIPIQAVGLSKSYGHRVVLDRIDLKVHRGECVALGGANGAGKTTLLRCMAALARPTAGELRWFGRSAAESPSARRRLGMLAHGASLYTHLTVRENLLFAARMYGAAEPARRVDDLLRSAGLELHARRPAAEISRGMRQRAAVLRALVHAPPILLLDEPFSGLDAQATDWLVGLLGELRARGCTVCMATHDRQKARLLADRTFQLESGRLQELEAGLHVVGPAGPAPSRAA